MPDVALATSAELPKLWDDDAPLVAELASRGISAEPVVWDDPAADWSAYRLVMIRSTWDYPLRRDEFVDWADRVGALTQLCNSADVVRWNTHKGYLRDLEAAGLPVVPTLWFSQEEPADLGRVFRRTGWDECVVKPAVSAGGRDTVRAQPGAVAEAEVLADRLLAEGREVMVQPYVASVDRDGELAVVLFDGQISHAARKGAVLLPGVDPLAVAGDVRPEMPDALFAAVAERVAAAIPGPWLYARIDLVATPSGPTVMEVEATEPALFLRSDAAAAGRLVDAIATRL